ncbi:GNAT family N-acetyltransferase [Acholeplasma sp. OttesenSCG-928-E16]|nr:GNAT family N-acetyltransferase [Acholeplasma sp. OttesenSCG-928-E16]
MEIQRKNFWKLTNKELYEIMKLRSDVFVVEQNINYLDFDDLDYDAIHYFLIDECGVYAYLRVINKGNYYQDAYKIGRLCVKKDKRKQGIASSLMRNAIENLKGEKIRIAAQIHLEQFYQALGFKSVFEPFLEEGIMHIRMDLND